MDVHMEAVADDVQPSVLSPSTSGAPADAPRMNDKEVEKHTSSQSEDAASVVFEVEPPTSTIARFLDACVVFIVLHYIQIFWTFMLFILYLFRTGIRWPLGLVICSYIPFYLVPWQKLGGRPCKKFMLRPFWKRVQRYLRVQLEREVELDPSRRFIFGWHPHGILLLSHCAMCGGLWEKLFPGIEQRTLAASPLFWLPPMREVSIMLGAVDASKQYASRALENGYSISVFPGGSKEIYTTDPHEPRTQLVLRDRRGFIRLALRHGAPLVPVFVFGEKYAYHRFKHRTGFAYFVLRTLRVPFLIFWGRWGTFMPLPKTSLSVVVGKPVEVPKVEGVVSEEVVNDTLARYTEALTALFERHKHKYARFPDEYLHIR